MKKKPQLIPLLNFFAETLRDAPQQCAPNAKMASESAGWSSPMRRDSWEMLKCDT